MKRNHDRLFAGLCLIFLSSVCRTEAKRWNTNKDSVVVDAQYNKEIVEFQSDDVVVNNNDAECHTSQGDLGECVSVIRCHPILFSEKGQLRNAGLALTYAQTEDVCLAKNTLDGMPEASNSSDTEVAQKVICCAKEQIQYDFRSELQDFEPYSTTSIPTDGDEGTTEVSAASQNNEVVEEEILVPSTLAPSEEVVLVEEGEKVTGTSHHPESDVEVTTQGSYPETSSSPSSSQVVVEEIQTGAPPQVPQQPEEEESFDPDMACPSSASYGNWPIFQDYPWLAAIQTRAKTGPVCSGSLITESHILSAAHCIHRFNSRDVARMQIRIGFSKRSSRNDTFNDYYVLRNASKIIFHKRFHELNKMDNNIALIKLDEPVEFDGHIAPIGVFKGMTGFDVGNCSGAEAGWVKYGNRKVTGISPGVIHYVEAPHGDFHLRESISQVLSEAECSESLGSQTNEKMICAKTSSFEEPNVSTDFFRWNDGGPLIVKVGGMVQQIGIKSWAYEGQQYPTVYTRVDSYLSWIRNNLKM